LKKWQEGMDISIANIEQLLKDGYILMKNGSYGHAFFLLITAFEEIAIVYFIMDNYNNPKPRELHKRKFLTHFKKYAYSRFKTFLMTGHINFLKEYLNIIKNAIEYHKKKPNIKKLKNLEKKVQTIDNIWNLRNDSIYTSIDQNSLEFKSPLNFDKRITINTYNSLKFLICNLKVQKDSIVHFGPKVLEFDKYELDFISKYSNLCDLFEIVAKKDTKDLINHPSISNKAKEFLIEIIKNKESLKNPEKFNSFFNICYKNIADSFIKSLSDTQNKEMITFYIKEMQKYYPKINNLFNFIIKIFKEISENKFDIKKYPDIYRGLINGSKMLKFK
jgi:AbiV family abortive infection protein